MTIKTIRLRNTSGLTIKGEREVKAAIIMLALFCAGMIIGAGILRTENTSDSVENFIKIFSVFISNRSQANAFNIFINSLTVNIVIILMSFLCGLNCIGIPFISIIPVIRGIGYGMLAGHLINYYQMSGIGYYLLTVFPAAVISVSVLILSCSTSVITSCDLLKIMLAKQQSESKDFYIYLKKYFIYILITLCSCIIETIISKSFAYLFSF